MLIVVISDTHMPKRAKQLPRKLQMDLKSADLIIHAGDWQTLDLYEDLLHYAHVEGVSGNVDDEAVIAKFGRKKIVNCNGVSVGIIHGHGNGKTTEKRALEAFENDKVDLIIFGHSHIPLLKREGDLIVFNPGSPTDKRRQAFYSHGIITIVDQKVEAKHVFYESKGP